MPWHEATDWLEPLPDDLYVGPSSFSWDDWQGVFYPDGLPAGDRISYVARQFPAVEADTTFYHMPSASMIAGWAAKTPPSFRIALKVPKVVTHEKDLVEADDDIGLFLERTGGLGERRGPLLLQFAYVAKGRDAHEYETGARFQRRLAAFLATWGDAAPWAVEVRNTKWLSTGLLDLLREHRTPLCLAAYYTMPSLARLEHEGVDPFTGDFAYFRFIGNHREMDKLIGQRVAEGKKAKPSFDEVLIDREAELRRWIESMGSQLGKRKLWVFINNHYAGFSPATIRLFSQLWTEVTAAAAGDA